MTPTPTTALITGAASGLGRELALQLARAGWAIAGLDLNLDKLNALADDLQRDNRRSAVGVADVTDASALRTQCERLRGEMGPLDLVVACAGTALDTPAEGFDMEEVNKVVRVNLLGVANTLAAVLPDMLERKRGHLVAVSSLASLRGLPRMAAYSASKAGVNALMESVRLDVGKRGIDVTTVCPGWTRTPLTESRYRLEELLTVEESAAHILWAIQRRKRFYAYPWKVVWQLRLLNLLPRRMQDWLLCRRVSKLRTDGKQECAEK